MKASSLAFRALEFYGNRLHHRGQWWIHGKLRNLLNANVDSDFAVIRAGLRWVLNPSDYTESEFFWIGSRDRWDTHHLINLLKPRSVMLDVGANFGCYSIVLAARTGGEVYPFEPNPATFSRLTTNIRLNGLTECVRPFRIGLSDRTGPAYLVRQPGNSGAARVSATSGDEAIELSTLDEFCEAQRIDRVDLVKIDVEGLEERVLRGGKACLDRLKPLILIELHPPVLARQDSSVECVVDLLHQYGYQLYVSARERILPLASLPQGSALVNAFCFHESNLQAADLAARSLQNLG